MFFPNAKLASPLQGEASPTSYLIESLVLRRLQKVRKSLKAIEQPTMERLPAHHHVGFNGFAGYQEIRARFVHIETDGMNLIAFGF